MLIILILGMLTATGVGQEGAEHHGQSHDGGHDHDFGGHNYDWLSSGGITYYHSSWNSYPWYYSPYTYPSYYNWYYPTYYSYPSYYYSYPYTYPSYYSNYWYYPTYTYSY